jgi:hypothetical protein
MPVCGLGDDPWGFVREKYVNKAPIENERMQMIPNAMATFLLTTFFALI